MALTVQLAQETVQLRRLYAASTEQVFNAWGSLDALHQWFVGPASYNCKVEKYDFTVGGEYQIHMIPISEDADYERDTGQDHVCVGQFVEIIPNEKIVMTFTVRENRDDIGETLLTIELQPVGNKTELTLTHERLPDETLRDSLESGWQSTLDGLAAYLAKQ